MSTTVTTAIEGRDLVLTCVLDAAPNTVYRAWTEPELMKKWFTPRPWTTPHIETDVRPGGSSLIVMRGPDGTEFPNRGVYLEVVPDRKLVFTDAFSAAWELTEKPFMLAILTFEYEGGKTRYTARVRHWNEADREAHEKMGFREGWAQATRQLAEVVEAL